MSNYVIPYGEQAPFALEQEKVLGDDPIMSITPDKQFILHGNDGRKAVLDFSGKKLCYQGGLPPDDGAQVFLDAVGLLFEKHHT